MALCINLNNYGKTKQLTKSKVPNHGVLFRPKEREGAELLQYNKDNQDMRVTQKGSIQK